MLLALHISLLVRVLRLTRAFDTDPLHDNDTKKPRLGI
jgi:hypothetical protein